MIGKMRSKKDNIAEYILYLWQMEDYLRAFPQHAEATEELHELNEMMHREGIMDGGHLAIANNALEELEELHATLLNEDAMYRAAIIRLTPQLNLLKAKTDRPTLSDSALSGHAAASAEERDQLRDRLGAATGHPRTHVLKQDLS